MIIRFLILAFVAAALSSCAWIESHKSQIAKSGEVIAKRAAILAGEIVLDSAISQLDREHKGNYLDSLSLGVRSLQGNQVVTSSDIERLIGIWTPEKLHWDELGSNLASLYDVAKSGNAAKDKAALEAIARGLQQAARPIQ